MIVITSVAFIVVLFVILPFFIGRGGMLVPGTTNQSVEGLESIKGAIVKRYFIDEKAFAAKELSGREWRARKDFLLRRYIDAERRRDFLARTHREQKGLGI